MFLSSGTLVESVETKVKTLEHVLRKYVVKRFTGHVVYRNDSMGIYIFIAMIDGNIAACRSIRHVGSIYSRTVKTIVFEGTSCCEIAMKYLNNVEGVVEVYSLDRENAIIDLLAFPLSRVEESVELASALGTKVGIPITMPTPKPTVVVEKPPISQVEKPPIALPTVHVEVKEEVKVSKIEITQVLEECINPMTLYMIIRSSQLVELMQEAPTLQVVFQKMENIAKEKKPKYIYVSGNTKDAVLRVVYDAQANSVYAQLEKGGIVKCGKAIVEDLAGKSISSTRIWIVP